MKSCPVCKAISFDDIDICYNCMYHFDEELPFRSSPGKASAAAEMPSGMPALSSESPLQPSATFAAPGQGFNLVISVQPAQLATVG